MADVFNLHAYDETPTVTDAPEPYLVFTTPGLLDMNFIKLLGVSVKENDSPIGFFGTGLKYAIATCLRLGGKITIIAGEDVYKLHSKTINLRGEDFQQVMLNDEPLGFTTDLGKQWEAWHVVREIYSNTLDENGQISISQQNFTAHVKPEQTTIMLYGQTFLDVWNKRADYFIDLKKERPVHTSAYADAFSNIGATTNSFGHNHSVFYRGIRVHQSQEPLLYRYNLKSKVTLTEDRTLKYSWELKEAIERVLMTCDDYSVIYKALTSAGTFENKLEFTDPHTNVEMSPAFEQVCASLQANKPQGYNRGAVKLYKNRTSKKEPMVVSTLTKVQENQLQKAKDFVARIGFAEEVGEYQITVVNWLGQDIYGLATHGVAYISRECFDKGTKFLASTILEELIHLKYGYQDLSRALQTWLFDRIITMGEEHVTGEAL